MSGLGRKYFGIIVVAVGCLLTFGCGGAVEADAKPPVAALLASSPNALSFGDQLVNTSSAPQPVTLTNTGTVSLSITSVGTRGDYAQSNNCGMLAANASCTVNVVFKPTKSGTRSGTLAIGANGNGNARQINLTGVGESASAPAVSLNPSSLTFASQVINSTSAAQIVTLTNTGTASLSIASLAISGDFTQSSNCSGSLAAGTSCTVNVTFTPMATGTRTGALTVTDNASGSPHQVALSGTGANAATPAVSLSPTSVTFASQVINTASAAQIVTLKNTGTASLSITSIAASGDYAQSNNCGTSLTAGASCTVSVTFTPTATGTRTGALTVGDNASGSPHQVGLSGTGANAATPAASLSPTSLTFASQVVNTASAAQIVTLKNTGTASLGITSIAASGDYSQTNNCGSSLAASSSCTINVTFQPTATGTRTGTLSVSDNASGSPHTVSLSGTGVSAGQLVVSPTSIAFGNVTTGQSSTKSVTLTNSGEATITVSAASTSGPGFSISGLTLPVNIAAGKSFTFSVLFAPSNAGTATGSVTVTATGATTSAVIALTGTGVAPIAHSVDLNWTASTSTVIGYNVYRGTQTGGPYVQVNSGLQSAGSFTDSSVQSGVRYFYVVTAVDAKNVESSYSNEAVAAIPTP